MVCRGTIHEAQARVNVSARAMEGAPHCLLSGLSALVVFPRQTKRFGHGRCLVPENRAELVFLIE